MHTLGTPPGGLRCRNDEQPAVMTDGWAEAIVELRREQSRRRHPSVTEGGDWEKDGAFGPTEWVI